MQSLVVDPQARGRTWACRPLLHPLPGRRVIQLWRISHGRVNVRQAAVDPANAFYPVPVWALAVFPAVLAASNTPLAVSTAITAFKTAWSATVPLASS